MAGRRPSAAERDLGVRLRSLRLLGNLTQAELAVRAGVSLQAVRGLENGTGTSLHTLVSVVQTLGLQEWLGALARNPPGLDIAKMACGMLRRRARGGHDRQCDDGG